MFVIWCEDYADDHDGYVDAGDEDDPNNRDTAGNGTDGMVLIITVRDDADGDDADDITGPWC